jgi:protein-tyrosine kinase
MEKLQVALEKARKNRQTADGAPPKRTTSNQTTRSSGEGEDLWQALTPFDLDNHTLEQHRVVTRVANAKATSFDILRTKVLLQMRQNGWKRLAITSPMPHSGKTTMACNLALGFGRQAEMKSMVLDLDLRNPSISDFLDVQPEYGIGDVLNGSVDFADQAMRFGPNVAFSMAKKPDTDPTQLLLSEETAQVLDRIEEQYTPDVMIFDLPSMLVSDDTRAFLKNVDCALIVIRANKTRYSQFDVSEREIAEQTNVLGVVLNAYRNTDIDSKAG